MEMSMADSKLFFFKNQSFIFYIYKLRTTLKTSCIIATFVIKTFLILKKNFIDGVTNMQNKYRYSQNTALWHPTACVSAAKQLRIRYRQRMLVLSEEPRMPECNNSKERYIIFENFKVLNYVLRNKTLVYASSFFSLFLDSLSKSKVYFLINITIITN